MNSANITLTLPYSFTRRNISEIVRKISDLKSNIFMVKDGRSAQMKSMLGLISLCCNQGDTVQVVCMSRDSDVDDDLKTVVDIINSF